MRFNPVGDNDYATVRTLVAAYQMIKPGERGIPDGRGRPSISAPKHGFPYLTVYRPDLLQVLVEAVLRHKADAIHLGMRCNGFCENGGRVTVTFENGTQASGEALIGADDVHSGIRSRLFGGDRSYFPG